MDLLASLHRSGLNAALVAGLILMPSVIAVGYWTDREPGRTDAGPVLRGTLDADSPDADRAPPTPADAVPASRRGRTPEPRPAPAR